MSTEYLIRVSLFKHITPASVAPKPEQFLCHCLSAASDTKIA